MSPFLNGTDQIRQVSLTVQTHDSDAIRFHRFELACYSAWKYHFQTVRDNTKQSDWPLLAKFAPPLHSFKLSPTFFARLPQFARLRLEYSFATLLACIRPGMVQIHASNAKRYALGGRVVACVTDWTSELVSKLASY